MARWQAAGNHGGMAVPIHERTEIDQVLEVLERRGLSLGELRVLLALLDREASLAELAEGLDKPVGEVWRSGSRLARRGLVRWYHVGPRDQSRLTITVGGRATVQALTAEAMQDRRPAFGH
jgi:DNA-binding MarR family transcriptional regulator